MGDVSTNPQTPPSRSQWAILEVVSIGTLMSTLDGGMVGVSFPALSDAFDTDSSTILWVSVAFWATSFGLLPTLGWLGDVHGRKRVYTVGSLVFAVGILAASVAPNVWALIAIRVVQAVGSAMVLSNLNAVIAAAFPAAERGRAIGVSGAVVGIGLSVGPLAGGALIDALGWQSLFYSRVPLGLLGALLAWRVLPGDRIRGGRFRLDLLGSATLFGTLAAFLLIVNQGGRLGFDSPVVLGLGVVAVALLPVLVWTERRSERPIMDASLFKSRNYTFALLVQISHYLAHGGIILVAPFFFVDSLDFSATKMGIFIAAFYAARTVMAPAAGWLSDAFGPRRFLVLGNALFALALFWVSREWTGSSEPAIFVALLLAGVGSAFFEPVVTTVIMGAVPVDRLGTASASVAMGRHIAFAAGVALAGAVFAVRERGYLAELGESGAAEAIGRGFSDTMLTGVVLAVAAVLFSTRIRSRTPAV